MDIFQDSNDFLLFDTVEKKFQLSPAVLPDSYCVQQQFSGMSCPKFTKNKVLLNKCLFFNVYF